MQPTYFITGTDTGTGKTVLTTLLAAYLRSQKIRVAAFKPVCSGGRALTLDEINPWHFRAGIAPVLAARREKQMVRRAEVLAHIRALRKNFAVTLVEGAGGLLSPLGEDFDSRDLILALRATPVIVAPNRLGAVNHLLLTLAALPVSVRAKAKVVFMSPPKPDTATGTNTKLLGEFFPQEKIFTLPWLGRKIPPAVATGNLRRILQDLIRA